MSIINKYLIVVVAIFLSILLSSCKAEVKKEKRIEKSKLVESFFQTYNVAPKEAVRDIYKSSKWLRSNIRQVDTAYVQLNSIINQLGSYNGYEIIKSIKVGESYRMISALGKYDRQPIRFNFILYKPKNKWQIQYFNFDLNIESELEQNITIAFDY